MAGSGESLDMARRVLPPPSLLAEVSRFPTFLALVVRAGLVEELDGVDPFTVFAPTEAAFGRLPPALRAAIGSGPVELAFEVAEHHVVRGVVHEGVRQTVQGERLSLGREWIGEARRASAPIVCRNGVVIPVDAVLVPRWGKDAPPTVRLRQFLDEMDPFVPARAPAPVTA